jgi:dethiobiotin synthetase
VVLVLGTGTEVGKTWVSARVLERWRADGRRVAARKPAQSFDAGDDDAGRTDAQVLAGASGEDPLTVCPRHRWYPVAMAPPMAAAVLAQPPVVLDELVAELGWPDPAVEVGLVEAAGGVRSPVADDGDGVALGERLDPDAVLLVADAGLGTVNAVVMSVDALGGFADRTTVFLNRFDAGSDLHRRNAAWLQDHHGCTPLTDLGDLATRLATGASSTFAS